ncbi:MAG: glucose-1-phosphate cytidylyltransferase [Oligoflexia bacterium]|nr:glucose-1-phosphate cytidylyltransferase [Oligoflexia bacterium]
MKAVILAGGLGTRISEESQLRPKPMVEIGNMPILWHIMKLYSYHGINDFIICLGYKGKVIKDFFANYFLYQAQEVSFDLAANKTSILKYGRERWRVTLVDTGQDTQTGGRLARVRHHIGNETFCLTYGDGLSDVNIRRLIAFHRARGTTATLTAVRTKGKHGTVHTLSDQSVQLCDDPQSESGWMNGGFFVLEPGVFNYIAGDNTVWERAPLEALAQQGLLSAYRHTGFWQSMDTVRDLELLQALCKSRSAPWMVWDSPRSITPLHEQVEVLQETEGTQRMLQVEGHENNLVSFDRKA